MGAGPSPRDDQRFMSRALELALAQLGKTSPNPSVGCVIVANGAIVGEGATGNGGRPHAEEIALAAAGARAKGATTTAGSTSPRTRVTSSRTRRVAVAVSANFWSGFPGVARSFKYSPS